MLSQYPGDENKRNKKKVLIVQRRIILIFLTILTISALTFLAKTTINILKQNQADNVIVSAQNEAKQILSKAECDAETITETAKVSAQEEANQILSKAKNDAGTITETAETKADKIIYEAINTKIDDVQTLLDITEAEAGNQSVKGKAAVAATIRNRMKSDKFDADTVKEVVYSPGQFDPVSNGKIQTIKPSPSTVEAVKMCLEGRDYSNGALYFYNPTLSRSSNVRWFNNLETTAVIGDHVFKK